MCISVSVYTYMIIYLITYKQTKNTTTYIYMYIYIYIYIYVSSLEAVLAGLELAIGALLKFSRKYRDMVPHSTQHTLNESELESLYHHSWSFSLYDVYYCVESFQTGNCDNDNIQLFRLVLTPKIHIHIMCFWGYCQTPGEFRLANKQTVKHFEEDTIKNILLFIKVSKQVIKRNSLFIVYV